jgi:PAS domain S-box-containing protein
VLPFAQSAYFLRTWEITFGTTEIAVNVIMQIFVFLVFSELISMVSKQRLFRIQLLESMPVGLWIVNGKGRLMHTNKEGLAIWGGDPKEDPAKESRSRLFHHGTDIEIAPNERPVVRAVQFGDTRKNEVLDIVTGDGVKRVISSSIAPVRDRMDRIQGAVVVNQDITEAKMLEKEREDLIRSLEEARANIKILSGLLPICASCKKIRDEKGAWEQMERYIHTHSEAEFSHGICPDCMHKLYPEYSPKIGP